MSTTADASDRLAADKRRRAGWWPAAAVVCVAVVGGLLALAVPASAQEGPAIRGTMTTDEGEPVEGVEILVERDGEEIDTATTDADGEWLVAVPETGSYAVTLDRDTLPEDVQLRNEDRATLDVEVRTERRPLTVNFALGEEGGASDALLRTLNRVPEVLLQGVKLGAILAMAAIGLSLVFGTTHLINFAHGDMVTFGAILAWFLNVGGMNLGFAIATAVLVVGGLGVALKASLWQVVKRNGPRSVQMSVAGLGGVAGIAVGVALVLMLTAGAGQLGFLPGWMLSGDGLQIIFASIVAAVGGCALGAVMDRGVWQPLRARDTGLVQLLVVSIGFSLLLRHVLLLVFGGRSRPYVDYTVQSSLNLGPFSITPRDLIITLLSVVILVLVALALTRTRLGKAMRAVSDNRDLAESSGINVRSILLLIWVMGGGLAALGGVFFGVTQTVSWFMGFELLLYMFAGVILGGIGTAFGAMVGSLVVGLVTELSTLVFSPEFKLVWALLVLIVVLLVRPQGILGLRERVG